MDIARTGDEGGAMGGGPKVVRSLRAAAERVEVHRETLSGVQLTWWEGPAADLFRERVAGRAVALARLAEELVETAGRVSAALGDGR